MMSDNPFPPPAPQWFEVHDNLVLLVNYLADVQRWDGHEIANVVEKPWHYEAEYQEALAAHQAELAADKV